jgi:hypothetical protein
MKNEGMKVKQQQTQDKARFSIGTKQITVILIILFAFTACENEIMIKLLEPFGVPEKGKEGEGTLYTINYEINGADNAKYTDPFSQTESAGDRVRLRTGADLHKYGTAFFQCWNTSSSGYGTDYNAGSYYTVNGDITLYAKWSQYEEGKTVIRLGWNKDREHTPPWYEQWQGYVYDPLLNNIQKDNKFTLNYTFTSNVKITDKLEIYLVDTTGSGWNVFSDYITIEPSISANVPVSGTRTLTAISAAPGVGDENNWINQLVFRVDKVSGAEGEPILTFTRFNFTKN